MNPLIPNAADIPQLPSPAPFERFFLESPLPVVVVLVVLGLIAAIVMLRRGKVALAGGTAAAGLVLGGAVWMLASSVTTTRERVSDLAVELVEATRTADAASLERLLFEEVRVTGPFVPELSSRSGVVSAAERLLVNNYSLESADVVEVRAGLDNDLTARTQLRVSALPTGWNRPSVSWWEVTWRQDPARGEDAWVATKVELLWLQGLGS